MSRHMERIARKDHGPWDVARPTVELRVYEVADAAKEQTRRTAQGDGVRHVENRNPMTVGEHGACARHADHRAMKGEAPSPNREDLCRMRSIFAGTVD